MDQKAISPVIGIILMVAVTVALVGLVTFTVLNISSETSNSDVLDSSIKATQTSEGLQTTVIKDNNIKEYIVQGPEDREIKINPESGNSKTISDGAGQYNIIAITNDGSRQVVTTKTIEENTAAAKARSSTFTQEGSVTVNPDVVGAIVKSTEDGTTIDVTQTDLNGEFSVGASQDGNITVIVQGFTYNTEGGDKTLYASGTKRADQSSDLNFDFKESSAEEVTINGKDLLISYNPDSTEKEVGTSEQLQAIDKISNGLSSNYEIVDEINVSNSSNINEFNPIGTSSNPFTGTIDGNGKIIKNLEIRNSSEDKTAFIKYSDNSNIKNITFVNPVIDGKNNTGVLIGDSTSDVIKNIEINNGEINGYQNNGGLVGVAESGTVIKNINTDTDVNSDSYGAGGIVGNNKGTLGDSQSSGKITGTYDIGGLVGYNTGDIQSSTSSSNIIADGNAGGLIGGNDDANADIINSVATGSVTTNSDDYTGGLVGYNYGNIEDSYSTGNVISQGDYVGGLVGWSDTEIIDSNSSGDVSGVNYVGGLIGYGDASNCYASGDIDGSDYVGGLLGYGEASDCYALGETDGNNKVGGLIGSGYASDSYATGNVNGSTVVGGLIGENINEINNSYATGNVNGTNDIGGLLGLANSNTVNNSYATGSVTGVDYIGGLIGNNDGSYGPINNSYSTGDVTSSQGDDVGGLIGRNWEAKVNNSNSSSTVIGGTDVGGLIGDSGGFSDYSPDTINNSYATGKVKASGNKNLGGLIGKKGSKGFVKNTYATGDVISTQSTNRVGGLIGNNMGSTIKNSNTSNYVESFGSPVGGLIGWNQDSEITNTYSTGKINGSSTLGGLIGENENATVSDSYSESDVNGSGVIGGLIGFSYDGSEVTGSYTTGVINGTNREIGGLIGSNNNVVSNSYTTGKVNGTDPDYDPAGFSSDAGDIGGLVGENDGTVKKSYSTAEIDGNGVLVGGLVGYNLNNVQNSYAINDVSGTEQVGGLVGQNGASISTSYSASIPRGDSEVGGLIGKGTGSTSNSYWDSERSGTSSSGGGSSLTTSEMQGSAAETNMGSFDFTNTWKTVTGDYPELQD